MTFRRFFSFFCALSISLCSFAGIQFDNLDLNEKNELLFTIENKTAGTFSYRSVFRSSISDGVSIKTPEILTCFPERMDLLSKDSVLQIQNRWGTALYSFVSENLSYIEKAEGIPLSLARPVPVSVSPDGKWQCYVKRLSSVSGELLLQNTASRKTYTLNRNADFSYTEVPVKWSPDSSTLLYKNGSVICFANPDAVAKNVQIEERFRTIGEGTLNCAAFTRTQQLVFIDGDIVYRLGVSELYTLGLYSSFISGGTAAARLPSLFNPDKDRFFVNDDATEVAVIQNNKNVSLYKIAENQFSYVQVLYSRPYINTTGSVISMFVIWPEGQNTVPSLQVELMPLLTGKKEYRLYQITSVLKETLLISEPQSFAVNKSATKAAYYFENSVSVYDTANWKCTAVLPSEPAVSLLWSENDTLIVGGSEAVRSWNVSGGTYRTLFLASAQKALWDSDGNTVQAKTTSGTVYAYDEQRHVWAPDAADHAFRQKNSVQNGYFRVYTGESKNFKYENALYARVLSGKAYTWALISQTEEQLVPPRKVSLVFDALDSAEGVCQILSILKASHVEATFFINGEFIRRYPEETKQIAASGFECASLFYTNADLTAQGFIIDEDFVRRGLARNEDDFYACTGKELSLFWHAPLYRSTPLIRQAGIKAGYSYVTSFGGNQDMVTLEQHSSLYKSASELIENYMNYLSSGKPSAAILPVSTGVARGTRSDYLYEKLDLLINLLLESGYDIVSVSKL